MKKITLIVTLFLFILAIDGNCKLFRWYDEYGNIVISNELPENKAVKEIKIDTSVLKIQDVWEVKNKATEELEKMLRKIEDKRKKDIEEMEGKEVVVTSEGETVVQEKKWLPLKGMARNSTGEIEVTVTEENPEKYPEMPYTVYTVSIENQAPNPIKFSRTFTRVFIKNDEAVSHAYVQKKIARKKELTISDSIPEDEVFGPVEKKTFKLIFSPVKNPSIILFDKFVDIEDGEVEVDLIREESKKVAKKTTKDIKLGEFDEFKGSDLFGGGTSENKAEGSSGATSKPKSENKKSSLPPLPGLPNKSGDFPAEKPLPRHPLAGLECEELDRSMKSKYDIKSNYGLYVTKVKHNSSAYNANIKRGDVIETVNNQDIKRIDDLRRIIEDAADGETLDFYINRRNTWSTYQIQKR
ncbi:PDZ domain-containing protein [bacterium]|nr:PDZ domain-containing protein [bacterium]